MRKHIVILALLLGSLTFAQSFYTGSGYQKGDFIDFWYIELSETKNKDLKVNYPDIPCTSKWVFVRGSRKKIL